MPVAWHPPILDPIFLADSYGYRPKKSALDAVGATRERCWKYDWVLEFDTSWLIKFVEHRVADPHILRLIQKWLKAGVMEEGKWSDPQTGSPQGSVITPLTQKVIFAA